MAQTETIPPEAGTAGEGSGFKRTAVRGALWVTVTSAAAIPLTYYRNWILGQAGGDGLAVGALAIILLFVNLVTTFILFGGVTVVTNYLPKLQSAAEKSAFLVTYGLISCVPVLAAMLLIVARPDLLPLLLKGRVAQNVAPYFLVLLPIVTAASIANFAQAGLMDFRSSALLNQVPTLVTSVVATAGVLLFPTLLSEAPLPILAACFIVAYLLVLFIGGARIVRQLGAFRRRLFLPVGFWRYASFVHLNTVTSFLYTSIDQAFVLTAIGVKELGAYFVMLQMAHLCSFVPGRISQVMLASFAHLDARADNQAITRAYERLCRLTVVSTTLLILPMIFLSPWLARLYGPFFGTRYHYLILLAALVAIGSVGTINSMLIMAKERTGPFFANNVTVVAVQLLVTLALIKEHGVYAVIVGRAAASICGQVGNFSIIRWGLPGVRIAPPSEYWTSLVVVALSAAVAFTAEQLRVSYALLLLCATSMAFLAVVRFRVSEITILLQRGPKPRS